MAKYTDSLSLVKLRGEYFPLAERDYRLLRDNSVSVFRISEDTKELLQKTLLKKIKVEVLPWGKTYPGMLDAFKKALLKSVNGNEETFQFKHEQNWIMVMVDTSKEKTKEVNLAVLKQHGDQLATFMGRYGIRTKQEVKDRSGYQLTRFRFEPDENIVPSFYFGCKDDFSTAPLFLDFNLGGSARLRFSKKQTLQGEPTFGVTFEDKYGENWQEAFSRGFPFNKLKASDCEAAIEFFLALHGRVSIAPKKK